MRYLLDYLKKLHHYAGFKLYINYMAMMLISMFEGIGILLIIPVLSVIGFSGLDTSSVPFIDTLLEPVQSLPQQWMLPTVIGIYLGITLLQAVLQRNQTVVNMEIQQGFMRLLRLNIYQNLVESRWTFFLRQRKSDFNHILTQELARVGMGTFLFMRLSATVLFTAIQMVLALLISVKLTLIVLVSGLLILLYSRKFVHSAKKLGDETSDLSQSYMGAITDHFNGMKDIKTNSLESQHYNWFKDLCIRMEKNYNLFTKVQATSQLYYKAAAAVLIAGFIYVSVSVLETPLEQLALISLVFSRLWPRFAGLQSNWEQLVNTVPAFKSLSRLEKECMEAREYGLSVHESHRQSLRIQEGIECRDLAYRYDPQQPTYALQDISVTIPANQMTAIVGKSGAGKSTLIDLLMGLVQPEKGMVLVDGQPLTEELVHSLRGSISYVAQDPFLFHSTIRENLTLVKPDAPDSELWEALRFSASEDFIRKLPLGLDTVIGDRGIRLSGGERQRLVLARAILRKPSILILDEATSALDNENEAIIQEALERLKGKMTIIVIAHRLSTIRNADQVIVIENGRVIQQGGYNQLSNEKRGTFHRLLDYQRKVPAPLE